MRFLFVARNPSLLFQYERVIEHLLSQRHEVVFHLDSLEWRNGRMDVAVLEKYQAESSGLFFYAVAEKPTGWKADILRHKREIFNYVAYIRADNPISSSPFMIERQCQALYPPFHILMRNRLVKMLILKKNRLRWMSFLEKILRPDKKILLVLRKCKPDLVIATPFIFARSTVEPEYVKCALALGIPTCVPVFSWDNLTSKGVFQIIPDKVLVWNTKQKKELQTIHHVKGESVAITGAPSLDFWFEQKAKQSYAEFCQSHGLAHELPYIVYLCSSQTIAPDEHKFVFEFVRQMRQYLGGHCPTLLIRPHPLNIAIWDGWDETGTVVVPKSNRDIFYSREAKELFFETFFHSTCVIGINTTAMIEAAIVGKPCITIISERYKDTQERSGHFHHLTDAGFIFSARRIKNTCIYIQQVLDGNDTLVDARKKFVGSFVRPNGIDVQSSVVMSNILIEMATKLV